MTSSFAMAKKMADERRMCRDYGHLAPRLAKPPAHRILECPRCWASISWPTTDAKPDHGVLNGS